MSETVTMTLIWCGTEAALLNALSESGHGADQIAILRNVFVEPSAVSRWCGIEPPPAEADRVIYQAPLEADGSATWREYLHGAERVFAPEAALVFARIRDDATAVTRA